MSSLPAADIQADTNIQTTDNIGCKSDYSLTRSTSFILSPLPTGYNTVYDGRRTLASLSGSNSSRRTETGSFRQQNIPEIVLHHHHRHLYRHVPETILTLCLRPCCESTFCFCCLSTPVAPAQPAAFLCVFLCVCAVGVFLH